ncbi:hypothetical protein [Xanthomonas hortorum]|uniref:hypothetical protein n=2 Tax=Xanthomonas TaxID=338 RepID=UPI0020432AC0|nr:hypothetical protein [Xanthomonas hortorum]MCM5542802.1 hypothetical protein [Xanthomonas hortorum pv. pelargonii]MCM5576462.1 hypothetical protein [Xanthomonas hortorum pv. pelargonii]MCM5580737.1 hypothetical protein [Xanthomonas hortorum pv. pelargonii]MCM5597685.1 hypothetical protein [Xanthomonas hortorum pv. pelargonii]MCM5610391.1 hypothetical protein [Xanthomonas hortorum pv. pelargonii]
MSFSCSDCRSKFGGERSASLRLTEVVAGTTKAYGMTGAFPRNLIGEIQGPGRPLPGSLTWTVGGELVLAWGEFFATFDGFESKDVNKREAFYVTHWGVWVIDGNGKPASPDPLFVIGADQ